MAACAAEGCARESLLCVAQEEPNDIEIKKISCYYEHNCN